MRARIYARQIMEQSSMAPPTSTQMTFEASQSAHTLEQVSSGRTSAQNGMWRKLLGLLTRLRVGTLKWIRTAADHYAAAAAYEQLARLSDAELQRRGLSRASLARDVLATCDPADRLGDRQTEKVSEQ
jgi:hypothetical protein